MLKKVDDQLGVLYHVLSSEWTVDDLSRAITQKTPNVSMLVVDGIKADSQVRVYENVH